MNTKGRSIAEYYFNYLKPEDTTDRVIQKYKDLLLKVDKDNTFVIKLIKDTIEELK